MSATKQEIEIAARLYDIRDTTRRILGERYKERMERIGMILEVNAAIDKVSVLSSATALCKQRGLCGMDLMCVMSAVVELTEPTP